MAGVGRKRSITANRGPADDLNVLYNTLISERHNDAGALVFCHHYSGQNS